jgi:hypothetical protein
MGRRVAECFDATPMMRGREIEMRVVNISFKFPIIRKWISEIFPQADRCGGEILVMEMLGLYGDLHVGTRRNCCTVRIASLGFVLMTRAQYLPHMLYMQDAKILLDITYSGENSFPLR